MDYHLHIHSNVITLYELQGLTFYSYYISSTILILGFGIAYIFASIITKDIHCRNEI